MSRKQDELVDLLVQQVMEEGMQQELKGVPTEDELRQRYQLSGEFQEKMERLIEEERNQKKTRTVRPHCPCLKWVCVAAAVLLCGFLAWQVPPVRAAVEDTVFWFKDDYVQIGGDNQHNCILDPMKDPEYVPEGYVEVKRIEEEKIKCLEYQKQTGVLRIDYVKNSGEGTVTGIDKELSYSKTKLFEIIEAYYAFNEDRNFLWWKYNDHSYCITTSLPQEETIKVAESIMK